MTSRILEFSRKYSTVTGWSNIFNIFLGFLRMFTGIKKEFQQSNTISIDNSFNDVGNYKLFR